MKGIENMDPAANRRTNGSRLPHGDASLQQGSDGARDTIIEGEAKPTTRYRDRQVARRADRESGSPDGKGDESSTPTEAMLVMEARL